MCARSSDWSAYASPPGSRREDVANKEHVYIIHTRGDLHLMVPKYDTQDMLVVHVREYAELGTAIGIKRVF